jgi:DNA ligase (NAD+)
MDNTKKVPIIGSVCFTGKLYTMSRNEASKMAINAGYEVKSGVTSNLTYLVTNDTNTSSSKNKKAKALKIKILTEEQFL